MLWTELTEMDRVCFGSTSEVLNACLSCIGCLQCPCERFSVQQPENTNTDGKLALLTRVPPHPTFGTSAGSRNADCGPGFRRLRGSSYLISGREVNWAASRHYLAGQSLVRYWNWPDKSHHQLRTAMHHHPPNQERAINLSILTVSGPGEFSRVESN